MNKYTYRARDPKGKSVTGEVDAPDSFKAARLVKSKGYVVISINPVRFSLNALINKVRYRVTTSDVTAFTRQLATMINAGLPITESLAILRLQSQPSFQPIITQVLADVEGGESLSIAMTRHPKAFSSTYIALIKAGETGGVLDKILVRLAENMEREQEFRGKVKGALIYPIIIVVGMVIVSLIMIVFVIPRMTALYDQFGTKLPLPTQILLGISGGLIKFWPVLLLGGFVGYVLFSRYKKTNGGRRRVDEIILKLPIVGDLQRQIMLADLSRTLSLIVGAGVPILDGLSVVADVMSNVVIGDAVRDTAKQIEKGFPIAFSFAKHPEAFPYILSQMISVGEETGKMEDVLEKVAHVFETESEQKVKALTSAIEPIIMIFLGIGVAFLVISIILPIYNLTTTL